MEKLVALNAHAFVNLWTFYTDNNPLPELDFDLPWDATLHNHVHSQGITATESFADMSVILDSWIQELPSDLNMTTLVDELSA